MGPKISDDMKTALKEALKELLTDDDLIEKLLSKFTDKIHALQGTVNKQEIVIQPLEKRIQNLQQDSKMNNICIHNLNEEIGEKTPEKVLN